MSLTPEQKSLFDALAAPLADAPDSDAVTAHLFSVLGTLLRRKGDADFLSAVRSAYVTGIAGNPSLRKQCDLAREVIAVVIAKRPEIASAFAAQAGESPKVDAPRRAPDLGLAVPSTPVEAILPPGETIEVAVPRKAGGDTFEHAEAEAMARDYVVGELRKKLSAFTPEQPHTSPTMSYTDPPFFLWRPELQEVLAGFVVDHILPVLRPQLIKDVYRSCPVEELQSDAAKRQRYFAERRKTILDRLAQRLGKLQVQYSTAAVKNARRNELKDAAGGEPEKTTKIVRIPIQVPRYYNVLGVSFRLGTETKMQRVRVPVRSAFDLEDEEHRADVLMHELRDTATERGLALPAIVDFQFLRIVIEMDETRFSRLYREMLALLRDPQTSRAYILQKVKGIDDFYNSLLSDILLAMVFHAEGDGQFGFDMILMLCLGAAVDKTAMARRRPLLQELVLHRPEALARQICRTLEARAGEEKLRLAVELYVRMRNVLPRSRFATELEAGTKVFRAYGMMAASQGKNPVFGRILAVISERLNRSDSEMMWWREISSLMRGVTAADRVT